MIDSKRLGFTLIELLLTLGILSILMSVIIGAINPGKRIGAARDAVRKNDLGALARAVEAYWTSHGASFPGTANVTYDSIHCSGTNPSNADGSGWIEANLTAEMKTIPIDPLNNGYFFYRYKYDPNLVKFKLAAQVEADFKAAGDDGGSDPTAYETGTGKADIEFQ